MSHPGSDQDKYIAMTRFVDGADQYGGVAASRTFEITLDDFNNLRGRLSAIMVAVNRLTRVPVSVCLLCSAIANKRVSHKSGCPSSFNTCFKCLCRHSSKDCAQKYFNVATGFCFKCWMPLFDIFGFSFHSKALCDLRICTNACRDFLKPLAACFYHRRDIVRLVCPVADLVQYQTWLFSPTSASVSGSGQVPGILLLLEASFAQMTSVFE
jgi:hypothetical protein